MHKPEIAYIRVKPTGSNSRAFARLDVLKAISDDKNLPRRTRSSVSIVCRMGRDGVFYALWNHRRECCENRPKPEPLQQCREMRAGLFVTTAIFLARKCWRVSATPGYT